MIYHVIFRNHPELNNQQIGLDNVMLFPSELDHLRNPPILHRDRLYRRLVTPPF